ncbi:peptide-N4-asparagine amidase [Kribbella qitaiheensis]|uniref:peptide-N4-asparagine amidase n=1 Tax=Kribbella qitaiheensis TaxID=1544730 RepID=UPI0019D5E6BF|nr:peptide-N4-asparagine amidase [Kribbella qitaiheensis]
MRARSVALVSLSVLLLGLLSPANAAPPPVQAAAQVVPPSEFGTDYDDPRTPAPPVAVPNTRHCSVEIVRNGFKNFDPYTSTYTPPAGCRGPWSKVVLKMQGSVKGVQYDRLGHITIGGVGVFRTSTPEPSTDGISWKVEKDVTSYIPLLRTPQPVVMELGNVVNDTYTGVLDIVVTLDFYLAGHGAPPARTANAVLPLQDQRREDSDLVGTATLPRNTSRLLGEVYVTGSGGGCEEFWDTSAPDTTGYSCPDGSPYREVDVLVDGKLAGIALPYPYIYTGGWSNPYSWRPSPAPRAFDIKPLYYDLTPFAGLVSDGKPHDFRVHVAGVPARAERLVHRPQPASLDRPIPPADPRRDHLVRRIAADQVGRRHGREWRGRFCEDDGVAVAQDQRVRRHVGRTDPHHGAADPLEQLRSRLGGGRVPRHPGRLVARRVGRHQRRKG